MLYTIKASRSLACPGAEVSSLWSKPARQWLQIGKAQLVKGLRNTDVGLYNICTKLLLHQESEDWRPGLVSWLASCSSRAVEIQTFEKWPLSLFMNIRKEQIQWQLLLITQVLNEYTAFLYLGEFLNRRRETVMLILSLESIHMRREGQEPYYHEDGRQTHLSTMGTADSRPPMGPCPKQSNVPSTDTSCTVHLHQLYRKLLCYFSGFKSVTFQQFYSHLHSSAN